MFVRAANPIWYMVDHVGESLNDEYYAFFLTNTLPYLPQNVYRDPQGLTVWTGDIVQFSPAGTLPDNLYFDPDLVYRIEIRHGNSQTDELIWEINNFVPGQGSNTNNDLAILANDNQISNPQFALINFVSPLTITTAGTYSIAPGWDLVLVGTGSTTITQNILSGSQNIVNSPPFSLRFNNSGWTTATLRQRFSENGSIWANGAVTMQLTGRAQTTAELISMVYSPSSPGTPQVVASGTLTTGDYQVLMGAVDIVASTNSTLNDEAYTDVLINLPASGIVDISNIQVIGQGDPLPSDFVPATDIPLYQQQTNERELDHLFNVYAQQLIQQPKKSLLTGWNFSLNPFQFNPIAITSQTSQTVYIADQTILHQATANSLQTGKSIAANGQRFGLSVSPIIGTPNDTRFALIQYIDPATVMPYWSYILSSLVRMKIFTNFLSQIRVKMRLIWRTDLPPTISNTEPISSWPANSDPVFAAGWTAIAPLNDPAYVLPFPFENSDPNINAYIPLPFDHFQLPNESTANMTLGIVLYTMDNMDASADHDVIIFDKVSLLPNKFACDADPQTYDQVLEECQYYYEKSYNSGILPGTISLAGTMCKEQIGTTDVTNTSMFGASVELRFNTVKRAAPSQINIYSPGAGTNNRADCYVVGNGAVLLVQPVAFNTNWALTNAGSIGTKGSSYFCNNGSTLAFFPSAMAANPYGFILFHYTADSRLGV